MDNPNKDQCNMLTDSGCNTTAFFESESTSPTLSPSEENMHQDDIRDDDNLDMKKQFLKLIVRLLTFSLHCELNHDVAIVLLKRVSCFAHTFQGRALNYTLNFPPNLLQHPKYQELHYLEHSHSP